ncbi:hypothetical protein DFQ27_000375, partial [Actinomortierella ambigua]
NTPHENEGALQAYHDERYPMTKNSFGTNKGVRRSEITMGYMPRWVNNSLIDSMHFYRPMICVLFASDLVSLLLGCSSEVLIFKGEADPYGIMLNYILAACPTVVSNPWDVTDKGTGRFSKAMFTA